MLSTLRPKVDCVKVIYTFSHCISLLNLKYTAYEVHSNFADCAYFLYVFENV